MKISRILFLYSFLGSIFLIVSGVLNVKSLTDILYIAFLSPILAYFILSFMKVYKIKEIKLKPNLVALAIAFPIILSILPILMMQNTSVENSNLLPNAGNIETYPPDEPDKNEGAKEEFVISNNDKPVKIREKASVNSKIVGEISDGTIFKPEEISGDWYKIKNNENEDKPLQGWVHKSFVKLVK